MTRKGLLLMKKSSTEMRVVLSLIVIGVFFVGCEVPPAPASVQSASPVTPDTAEVRAIHAAKATQAKPKSFDMSAIESVPQTDVIPAVSVVPLPERLEPAVIVPDPPKIQPVVAAVDLSEQIPDGQPTTPPTEAVAAPASAVTNALKATALSSENAKVYVVNKICDFGEITPLDKLQGTFQIKNIGTETLYLTNVKLCCGAQHTLSSDTLAPGETSVLTVTYRGTSIGPFEKYLNVYTNDAHNSDVKLTIKGMVVRHLKWTPDRFKLFLDKENAGCTPIKITSTDGKPFALTSFSATEDCLSLDIDPNKTATEFLVYPKVDMKILESLKMPKGIVRIKHTHPGCDMIQLNYDLVKRYAYSPQRFLVLNADPRQVRTQRLNILDNYADSLKLKAKGGDSPSMFTIEGISCQKGSAVLKSSKQITDGYQLTFDITPPDPAGQRLFQDLIAITLSTGDEIIVPVNGIFSMAALSAAEKQE